MDYCAGKYKYSLFPRKDEYQFIYMPDFTVGTDSANVYKGAANRGMLGFGGPYDVAGNATSGTSITAVKGFRMLAQHMLFGQENAELLSDYNQIFFPTLTTTAFNENLSVYEANGTALVANNLAGSGSEGNPTWLYIKPMATLFNAQQLIPPGTRIDVIIETAQRDPTEVNLMYRFPHDSGTATGSAAARFKYQNNLPTTLSVYPAILRMSMLVKTYRCNPETAAALLSHFNESGMTYSIPLLTVRTKILNTNGGNSITTELWNGRIPDKVIVCFATVDTRILDGSDQTDTVQPWTNKTFPCSKDRTVSLKKLDVRFNDVSMFAEPLEFDFANTAGGEMRTTRQSSLLQRTKNPLRQGAKAMVGLGMKRLELLLRDYIGASNHVGLPFDRHDLADGQFFVCVNFDPSGGPYDASMANWGSIKLRLEFEKTGTGATQGISASDNISMMLIGVTRRSIYHSFSGVSSSNFSGGLANA